MIIMIIAVIIDYDDYCFVSSVCTGSLGEVEAAHDMFRKIPNLIKRKNNQIEAFVNKRVCAFVRAKSS